jgi:hypothetical protein
MGCAMREKSNENNERVTLHGRTSPNHEFCAGKTDAGARFGGPLARRAAGSFPHSSIRGGSCLARYPHPQP